jgi:hypothetical protein
MSRQDGYFIVDGVFHTDLPVAFSQVLDDNFGVPDAVYHIADGQKVVAVQSPQLLDLDTYQDYFHRRKIHVQAWKADWGEESLMTVLMAEQLRQLYNTQQNFWIQYDDEMARCWGRLVGLNADLVNGHADHVYFTPHYPIFPFGHEPPDDPEASDAWESMLMVGRELLDVDAYSVYPDYGMVVINADGRRYHDRIKAHLKYTWRGYVRVKELMLSPHQLAQTYYTGTVVFEQVAIPISGVDLTWRDAPYTGVCTVYATVRTSTFAKIAIVSKAAGSRYGKIIGGHNNITPIRLGSRVRAIKDIVAHKYGRTVVSAFSMGVPGNGTVTAIVAVSETTTGTTIDSSGTGWFGSTNSKPLAELLADGDDLTYIYGSTFSQKFKLTSFSDPLVNSGHTLNIKWRRGTGGTTKLTVYLLQGTAKIIAAVTFTRSVDDDAVDTYTLSGAQADLITDYTNLYVEFYSDRLAIVPAFLIEIPIPGAGVIKTRSVTGNVAVQSKVTAVRPPINGYPELSRVKIVTLASGILGYSWSGND